MAETPYSWNEAVTRQRRARIHTTYSHEHDEARQPIDAVAHPTDTKETEPERASPGTPVEVRTQYLPGQWAAGYEVAEVVQAGYRIRCKGSQNVLSEVFRFDDVRLESDPRKSGANLEGSSDRSAPHSAPAQVDAASRASRSTAIVGMVQARAVREAAVVVRVVKMSRDAGREASKRVDAAEVVRTPLRSIRSIRKPIGNVAKPLVRLADPVGNLVRVTRGTQDLAERFLGGAAVTIGGIGRNRASESSAADLQADEDRDCGDEDCDSGDEVL